MCSVVFFKSTTYIKSDGIFFDEVWSQKQEIQTLTEMIMKS